MLKLLSVLLYEYVVILTHLYHAPSALGVRDLALDIHIP